MEIERKILVPGEAEEVWESLTDPERLEEWFATDVELDARPGGEGVSAGATVTSVGQSSASSRRRSVSSSTGTTAAASRSSSRRPRRARCARRRDLAGLRPRSGAARLRVDGSRGVDRVFTALGDAGRRSLVEAVAERGTATATELAAELPVTRQAVAKQLTAGRRRVAPGDAGGPGDALRSDAGAARGRRRVDGLGRGHRGTSGSRSPLEPRPEDLIGEMLAACSSS
jgi:Uncharacterized conserved protein